MKSQPFVIFFFEINMRSANKMILHIMEVLMKKQLLLLPVLGIGLSGCALNDAMEAMRCNTATINESTWVISENSQAIEEANIRIEENRRQIEAVNKRLQEMNKS